MLRFPGIKWCATYQMYISWYPVRFLFSLEVTPCIKILVSSKIAFACSLGGKYFSWMCEMDDGEKDMCEKDVYRLVWNGWWRKGYEEDVYRLVWTAETFQAYHSACILACHKALPSFWAAFAAAAAGCCNLFLPSQFLPCSSGIRFQHMP